MALTVSHPELSRWYFEREARFGRRVIFQWRASTRWPAGCRIHRTPTRCCVNCSDEPVFEGVMFTSESAAQRFDMEQMDFDGSWERYDSWEDAERWLRGGD